jgi:hypothetical protein
MFIERSLGRHPEYDLSEESDKAGFYRNVDHFKSYLAHCPKFALDKYGHTKYRTLRKQIGLPPLPA